MCGRIQTFHTGDMIGMEKVSIAQRANTLSKAASIRRMCRKEEFIFSDGDWRMNAVTRFPVSPKMVRQGIR